MVPGTPLVEISTKLKRMLQTTIGQHVVVKGGSHDRAILKSLGYDLPVLDLEEYGIVPNVGHFLKSDLVDTEQLKCDNTHDPTFETLYWQKLIDNQRTVLGGMNKCVLAAAAQMVHDGVITRGKAAYLTECYVRDRGVKF